MSKQRMAAVFAVGTLLLAGCIDRYRTETTYTPPSKPAPACINSCDADARLCASKAKATAENSQQKCERAANDDYERCLGNAQGELGRSSCTRRLCLGKSERSDSCEAQYQGCYQSCGGTVSSEPVCRFLCF